MGLIVICSAAFMVPFMGSALNLALPQISDSLSMKAVSLTWIATAYLLCCSILQVPVARLADMIGRKKVFITGIFLFMACTFISGFSTSSTMLITLRALTGLGAAMLFGTNIAILTSIFEGKERSKALGYNTAVVYAALAVGPLLGGLLTKHFGWQSVFFVTAGIAFIILIMALTMLKGEWVESKGEKFDFKGSIFYSIGLAGLIYGFSSLPALKGVIMLIIGIISFVIFVLIEKKVEFPVFNVKLLSGNKVFSLSLLAALINYAATFAITFMLSLYLQYVRGMDASAAGLILIVQAAVQSLFSIIAGNISSRIQPSILATSGMIIIVIGLAGIIFLKTDTPVWFLISVMVLFGTGFGIFSSPNTNIIMNSVEKRYYGQASAITGTVRQAGQSISMGIAGMAVSFHIGNNLITPDLYPDFMQSMRLTFSIFLALCLIGVYASSVRKR